MEKIFYFLILISICKISLSQDNQHIWTFDYDKQQWAEFTHNRAFEVSYEGANELIRSGHLEFQHQTGSAEDWLFGPTSISINADQNQHIHFSLNLEDAGDIPEAGIAALLVWTPAGNMGVLLTKSFKIRKGQNSYHIDLSADDNWVGDININRIHFPQGDQTGNGFTPETAKYALDWFAVTNEADFQTPEQDTTSVCLAEKVDLSEESSVTVDGTKAIIHGEMLAGNNAFISVELKSDDGRIKTKDFGSITNGEFDVELSFMKDGLDYEYKLIASNASGADSISGSFSIDAIETQFVDWTFDCWYDGWKGHSVSLDHIYLDRNGALEFSSINGGSFIRNQGISIDANEQKYMLLGVQVENAPDKKLNGKIGNKTQSGDSFNFSWEPGDSIIRVDLSNYSLWNGNIYHVWIYLALNAPADMVINIDWLAFSNNPTYIPENQQSECAPSSPVLTNPETVVFGNRTSMKTELSGGFGMAEVMLWKPGGDTVSKSQVVTEVTGVYFSFYDLDLNTNYQWQIEITNPDGNYLTNVQEFTTEDVAAEEMPMNYWMTPSPFKLTQNINDHLFDLSNWNEASKLVDVYKIHGALFNNLGNFDRLNVPKLIYTTNKLRMRLARESIVAGDRDANAYANDIFEMIETISAYGGKLEFLTWDGMMFRNFYDSSTNTKFRTADEGLEVVAEAVRLVKEKYPYFEIIPLPNLPNWDFKGILHNAGDWAGKTGVSGWDYLCDIYLQKSKSKGVETNFIEIDHPFNYYHRNSRSESARRIAAMKQYCEQKDMDLILIVNSSGYNFDTDEKTDAQFKTDCLQYLYDIEEDGIEIKYIDVESWYPYPQYLTPETKENSFTNILRDVGYKFKNTTSNGAIYENNGRIFDSRIYPIPADKKLTINIPEKIGEVSFKLFDVQGNIHKSYDSLKKGTQSIDVGNLSSGIYYVQLCTDLETITHRFVKK